MIKIRYTYVACSGSNIGSALSDTDVFSCCMVLESPTELQLHYKGGNLVTLYTGTAKKVCELTYEPLITYESLDYLGNALALDTLYYWGLEYISDNENVLVFIPANLITLYEIEGIPVFGTELPYRKIRYGGAFHTNALALTFVNSPSSELEWRLYTAYTPFGTEANTIAEGNHAHQDLVQLAGDLGGTVNSPSVIGVHSGTTAISIAENITQGFLRVANGAIVSADGTDNSNLHEVDFDHTDTFPIDVCSVIENELVTNITLQIVTAFDDPATTISVGHTGNAGGLMAVTDNVSDIAGIYELNPNYKYGGLDSIKLYIDPKTSTQGAGVLRVETIIV